MPNTKTLQSNFSSGELSDKAQGRTDIARYPNAVAVLENCISRTLGSADKRPGTEWLAAIKDSAKRARLVPYVKSKDEGYMLEIGEGYVRVFRTDGTQVEVTGTPYETPTVYTEQQAQELDYTQDEEGNMFLFHEAVFPQRLRQFAEDNFNVADGPFTITPFAELGDYPSVTLTLANTTVGTGRPVVAGGAVFLASDVGRAILYKEGIAVITAVADSTHATAEIKVAFPTGAIPADQWNLDSSPQATCTPTAKDPVGAAVTLNLSLDGWRADDVGKFVRINGGLVRITLFTSATAVNGSIIKELSATVGAPALAWTLQSSVWNAVQGYPRCGAFHEQRLVAAGTPKKPQTIWGSRIGEALDFTLGTDDDDGYAFTIGNATKNKTNPIRFLTSAQNLILLTTGGVFSMRGGVEKAITPTNIRIRPEMPHGCKDVAPVQVGKETVFAERAGRKLRSTKFDYAADGYDGADITTLGEHLTKGIIAGIAFQQEPEPIVWIWTKNGRLVSVTLDRELDVIAWCRHKFDGVIESVATIPAGDGEQVWLIVRRKVDGELVRYVERLQPEFYPVLGSETPDPDEFPPPDPAKNWGYQLDCAVMQDDEAGSATWDGLDHLEGREVGCIADGVWMGEFTVTGGAITLPRTAKRVLIGLTFLPRIVLLSPEVGMAGGTQGSSISTYEVWVNVYNTIGLIANGEQVFQGRINGPGQLDMPPQLYTGKKKCSMAGWSRDGTSQPEITQDAPLPFSVLSITRKVTINE